MKAKDQNCRKKTHGSDALPMSLCVHNGQLCLKKKEKERRRREKKKKERQRKEMYKNIKSNMLIIHQRARGRILSLR